MEMNGPPESLKPFSLKQTVALQGAAAARPHHWPSTCHFPSVFNFLLPRAGRTNDKSVGSKMEAQVAFPPLTSLLMVLDIQGPGLAITSLPTGRASQEDTAYWI